MSVLIVGSQAYPTIAAAMGDASAGDTLQLKSGYSNEAAVLTVQNLTIDGRGSSANIDLQLGAGIFDVTLAGMAAFEVSDNAQNNTITGNAGDNLIRVSSGADVVHGGGGIDRLVVDYASVGSTIVATVTSVTDGGIHSVLFDGVENFIIRTGAGDDTITTADGDNVIRAAGGNDTISTGNGASTITAGAGNDTVTTGDGGNNVNGGDGDNTITTGAGKDSIGTAGGNDTIETNGGADRVSVNGGVDTIDFGLQQDRLTVNYENSTTNVTFSLSAGTVQAGYSGLVNDIAGNSASFTGAEIFDITGGSGADRIVTGGGGDALLGRDGRDHLESAGGNDQLDGGGGDDVLIGGRDGDQLTGGKGADVFLFQGLADSLAGDMDRILDLGRSDSIDLSRIDANASQSGDQAFVMVAAFTGTAGEATFNYQPGGDRTVLSLDVDGDSIADFQLTVDGDHAGFDNFVL